MGIPSLYENPIKSLAYYFLMVMYLITGLITGLKCLYNHTVGSNLAGFKPR